MSTTPESLSAHDPDPGPQSGGRRRVLQRGLAAGPVLMTVASRPVLGAVPATTASAFASGNESSPGQVLQTSSGKLPSYWTSGSVKNAPSGTSGWPTGYYWTTTGGPNGHTATAFVPAPPATSITGLVAGSTGSTYQTTLYAVLGLADTPGTTQSLALWIAAALLNAANGFTPVLPTSTVQAMWDDFVTQGYFEPIAGIHWGVSQIVTYIRSTIG